MWFVCEALSGVFSQAIAEIVSKNPFVYYPLLVILFALGSLISTLSLFHEELKDFFDL